MSRIAIVGASEEVATDLIDVLVERGFDLGGLRLLADDSLAGEAIEAAGYDVRVEPAVRGSLAGCEVAIFLGDGALARELIPEASAAGTIVLDATPYAREELDAPVILPEVNAAAAGELGSERVIAVPGPNGVGLAAALAPLHEAATVKRVVTTVFESAAQRGRRAMDQLSQQSVKLMQGRGFDQEEAGEQLAFNVRPQPAGLDAAGWSSEERRLAREIAALFGEPAIEVHATVVRVPVFAGCAQSVYVELEHPIEPEDAAQLMRQAAGLVLPEPLDEDAIGNGEADGELDEDAEFAPEAEGGGTDLLHDQSPGPVEVNGSEAVHVARLRSDPNDPRALSFWIAFDELRKGTSLTLAATLEIALRASR